MDFFKAQEQARKKTRWLALLSVLAITATVALVCLAFLLFLQVFYTWYRDSPLGFIIPLLVSIFLLFLLFLMYVLLSPDEYYNEEKRHEENKIVKLVEAIGVYCTFLLGFLFAYFKDSMDSTTNFLNGYWVFWTCLIVGGIIAVASLYKIVQISRSGGRLIAEQLGGRRIMRGTADPTERRFLNVIDEISIAAGIPAPVAFVLDKETGLNAFAAGLSTQDSAIGITHGLLEAMNRDELQGVIAHEISHIVNGDSRLNLRLIGCLYGIYALIITGRTLPYSSHPILTALPAFLFFLVGSIGLFFGRLIQATTSREREYLADAAAVQFSRNPTGLISALQKMRTSGSQIQHPEAVVASHLFLGSSDAPGSFENFFTSHLGLSLFSTHPPLAGRIRRLGGFLLHHPDGEEMLPLSPVVPFDADHHLPILAANPHAAMPVPVVTPVVVPRLPEEILSESLNQAQNLLASLPDTLREQAHNVIGATGILAGLLFARQADIQLQQEKLLSPDTLSTAQELYHWLAAQPEHGAQYRLVWFDLILPTLREVLEAERDHLLILAKDLIRADGRVSPTEFALYSLLRGALLSPSERQVKQSDLRLERLDKDISDILALLAYSGHEDVKATEAAYQAAIASSPASTKHPLPAKNELSLNKISEALSHLALAAPPYRKKLLDACAVAVQHDGRITPVENELLRAFAQSLDCPAPMLDAWQQAA